MIKGIIFDMDGVLVNNTPVHIEAFAEWCKTRGIEYTPEMMEGLFGMGNDDIMRSITGNPNLSREELDQYGEEKEQIYRDMFASTIEPMPGLVDLLKELKKMGIKIAVGSSGMRKNVDFVLESCGITQYFDAISNGDMIKNAKPDPEVFILAAKLLGLKPEECLVFEDSLAGIEAARRAGMPVIALATTLPREQHSDYDYIIDDFTQIDAHKTLEIGEK